MSAQTIELRYVEHCGVPDEHKMAFPLFLTISLSHSGCQLYQQFTLENTPLPVGASSNVHLATKKTHFVFYAHKRNDQWNCKLVLHDVVPCIGTDMSRAVEINREWFLIKSIRWKMWEKHPALIGEEEFFTMIAVLLDQHLRAIGWDEFNKWLRRMTLPGHIVQQIPAQIPIL